jgi:hypothetical protein
MRRLKVFLLILFAPLTYAQTIRIDGFTDYDSGTPACERDYVRNFPQSDGASCSYQAYSFKPIADGALTVKVTPMNGYAWGAQGFPQGTPGMFAILGSSSNPGSWAAVGSKLYSSEGNSAAPVIRSLPVKANQTYYVLVGTGGWTLDHHFPMGSFSIEATLPPPVKDADAPLPFWSLGLLATGLIGIANRRRNKLNMTGNAALDG